MEGALSYDCDDHIDCVYYFIQVSLSQYLCHSLYLFLSLSSCSSKHRAKDNRQLHIVASKGTRWGSPKCSTKLLLTFFVSDERTSRAILMTAETPKIHATS